MREQRVGDVKIAVVDALHFHFNAVTRKVLAHIGAFDLVLLAAFVGDDDIPRQVLPARGVTSRRRSPARRLGFRPSKPSRGQA